MGAHPCRFAAVVGGGAVKGRAAHELHFELGRAYLNLTVGGHGGQKSVQDPSARSVVGVGRGIHYKVVGVVPFAPGADEAGLKHEDDVFVGGKQRLELLDVAHNPGLGGVPGLVAVGVPALVCKAQYALDAAGPECLEVVLDECKIGR